MNTDIKNIGDRLSQVLKDKEISQDELARMIGVQQPTISKICKNKISKSKYLPDIAEALNITVEWLLYGDKNESEIPNSKNTQLLSPKNKFILIDMYYSDNEHTSPLETEINKDKQLMFDKDLLPQGKIPDDLGYIVLKDTAMGKVATVDARVTFDKTNTSIISGKMYAILRGGLEQVRYLFKLPDHEVKISAEEKQDYPDEIINEDQDSFKILGKVLTITNIIN